MSTGNCALLCVGPSSDRHFVLDIFTPVLFGLNASTVGFADRTFDLFVLRSAEVGAARCEATKLVLEQGKLFPKLAHAYPKDVRIGTHASKLLSPRRVKAK